MNGHSVNGLPQREATRRALLVVTDGLGYDPAVVRDLARRVIGALDPHTRRSLLDFALEVSPGNYELLDIVRLSVMPIIAEGLSPSLDWRKALETLDKIRTVKRQLAQAGMLEEIDGIRRRLAMERRYIPWIAEVPEWSEIVDENLTVPTETSGVWVGYEDVDPPVQGNSETGHQQIGNLASCAADTASDHPINRRRQFFRELETHGPQLKVHWPLGTTSTSASCCLGSVARTAECTRLGIT